MRIFRALMALALLFCLSPLLSMAAADIIANIYGCKVDLAAPHPCIVGGSDIGQTLLTLGMMGYFLMATFPIAAGVAGVWIVVEIIAWIMRRRRRSLA